MNDLTGLTSGERDIPIIETPIAPRRLMVRCPVTTNAVDAGFELSAVPSVGERTHRLIDCLECGLDHSWAIEGDFLD